MTNHVPLDEEELQRYEVLSLAPFSGVAADIRTALGRLVAEVRRMRAENARLRATLPRDDEP